MTDTQRKKRAERIIETYRINYSIPFWTAYRDKDNAGMGRMCTRMNDFKYGVERADPHARWYKRLNAVDIEVKKMICPKDGDP